MVEQATFLSLKLEFENMVMSMLIINPDRESHFVFDMDVPPKVDKVPPCCQTDFQFEIVSCRTKSTPCKI